MKLHLYRPRHCWAAGRLRWLNDSSAISPSMAASLVRLGHATFVTESTYPIFGESMSDDQSSRLSLITAPASEPVSLSQAKSFLRVEHSADDTAITTAIVAARQQAEQHLRLALLPQTWELVQANPCSKTIRLSAGPAQSITSVSTTNEAGTVTVMDASNYRLSVDGFAVIFENVPTAEKVTVRYVAYLAATAAELPVLIIQGMLHHVAVMMEQRDGAAAMPMQSITNYAPYRRVSL